MHRAILRGRERRGLAPLEFVLSLPVLILMTVLIIYAAWSGFARMGAALHARHATWSIRHNEDQASQDAASLGVANKEFQPTKPLSLTATLQPASGTLYAETMNELSTGLRYRPRAKGGNALLAGTWDLSFPKQGPHFGVLARFGNVSSGDLGELSSFSSLLSMSLSTQLAQLLMGEVLGALSDLQDAQEDLEDAIDDLENIPGMGSVLKWLRKGTDAIDGLLNALPDL